MVENQYQSKPGMSSPLYPNQMQSTGGSQTAGFPAGSLQSQPNTYNPNLPPSSKFQPVMSNTSPGTGTGTAPAPTGGGGGGTGGVSSAPQDGVNQDIMNEANNLYNVLMGNANQAEGYANETLRNVLGNISSSADTSVKEAETQKRQSEADLTTAEEASGKRKDDAITAARQILSEGMMGYGQRFGTGSNIYKALGEYATTGFQKTAGSAKDAYQSAMTQFAESKRRVGEWYGNTINKINQWKSEQITNAQNEFRNKLLEISNMRGQAESYKSQLRIQELQRLQANIDNYRTLSQQYALQAQNTASDYTSSIADAAKTLGLDIGDLISESGTNQSNENNQDIKSLLSGFKVGENGYTQDNAITNNMVLQGKLPRNRLEIYQNPDPNMR